ncbi:MAG: hypothetical protein ABR591_12690, partial [Candidatus Velthaea sp.]
AVLAPRDAFEFEPVILPYVRRFIPREEYLEERSGPIAINDVEIRTSIRHRHPVETYGLHFRYGGKTVSYLPCTRFFAELAGDYEAHAPDVLIINVLRFRDAMDVDHLTFDDARTLIAGEDARDPRQMIADGAQRRLALVARVSEQLVGDPDALARGLEEDFRIRAYAAYDGWTYDELD